MRHFHFREESSFKINLKQGEKLLGEVSMDTLLNMLN